MSLALDTARRFFRASKLGLCGLVTCLSLLLLSLASLPAKAEEGTAILAGGCFWCIEKDFESVEGVNDVVSGYIGGEGVATYETHSKNGYLEAVRITYDPAIIDYSRILDIFWRSIDPTDAGGQFCDRGRSYTTAIFTLNDEQQALAEQSKAAVEASGKLPQPVATMVVGAPEFFLAEGYHQDYYKKSPLRYNYYRSACGRDKRVKALWGDEAYLGIKK